MKPPIGKRTWTLVLLIITVVIAYAIFELSVNLGAEDEQEKAELAINALQKTSTAFSNFEQNFARNSSRLSELVKDKVESSVSKKQLLNDIRKSKFWGVSIFRNQQLWLWADFGEENYPINAIDITERQHVYIRRDNNVTFISSQIPLFIEENGSLVRYDIFTRKKIHQENLVSIAKDIEIQPSDLLQINQNYPVHFRFFNALPPDVQFQTKLSTQSLDSVGTIYTLEKDFPIYAENQANQYFLYRAVFYLLLMLFSALFLLSISKNLETWSSLLLKLLAILFTWAFFSNIEYGLSWIELFPALETQNIVGIKILLYYCVNSFFFLLITLSIYSSISHGILKVSSRTSKYTPWLNLLFGFLSVLLIAFFFSDTYLLFKNSQISLLDLEILPDLKASVFYIASGVFAFSIISLLCLIGWFFLKSGSTPVSLQLFLMLVGFGTGLFILNAVNLFPEYFYWISITCLFFFLCIQFLFYLVYKNPFVIKYSSRLRLLILFGFLSAGFTYIAVYQGYLQRVNEQMLEAAESFIEEEDSQTETITRDLLVSLEMYLSGLTETDLQERQDFVESFFMQEIQNLMTPEWENYSISAQFIDTTGEVIAEYSSELDAPSWTGNFLIPSLRLQFDAERIRLGNIRPIIRQRPLNEANSDYSVFRRGFIPLHEQQEPHTRIGWILCSVYKERPQYDRPLRSVVAAEAGESWSYPINLTEFEDGRSTRNSIMGIPLELPGLFQLSDTLMNNIHQSSFLLRKTNYEGQLIRELFVAVDNVKIIRVATNVVGFDNHLFSILRYFFCLLVAGLILLGSLSWKEKLNILGHNRRFRDRLIDRFILASLLCLMVLSITSYFAINDQNKENVQEQLLSKVKNLAGALTEEGIRSREDSAQSLDQLSSALDADATLYRNETVGISTASQIYDQHILPKLLPWDVHESLYNVRNTQDVRSIKLGNHDLLIGYQPWFNDEAEIAGVVAIPTFLKAPKFNQQLLSTTSYLLGFYVLIFGFFIIGAAYISTQLTEPLESLREGLKKISGGDLKTRLPVNTKDEIGSLSQAYNIMVDQLQELQKELAIAEREAAWEQMAQQVAHEIKNPLTPMKLSLQHLERQIKSSDKSLEEIKPGIQKIIENMIEQIESLNHIASDFAKFAKPIEEEFKKVEVNSLLQSIAELYKPEEKITIETEFYPEDIYIRGVKEELRRVLVNLMKNAYEAMPNGGIIKICSLTAEDKPHVLIEIIDTGEGIPEENSENIFVPNFSTKSSGTGLGLAISKKIIEEHEGKISFQSTPGKGTNFRISLPILNHQKE